MLNVALVGDKELIAKLEAMPGFVQAALRAKVTGLALKLQTHVQRDKLSGQVLKVRTGALRRSIAYDVAANDGSVYGRVFSSGDVKYAAIHEFGGTTPPHDILPTKGDALAFMVGGRQVFAKVVHHPGSKMPERSFLRSALGDMAAEIETGLKQAVVDGLKKGLAH